MLKKKGFTYCFYPLQSSISAVLTQDCSQLQEGNDRITLNDALRVKVKVWLKFESRKMYSYCPKSHMSVRIINQ